MPYCPRLARFLLAALLAAVSSGLAFAVETPGPSRYEGRRFVPWAGDSADFQAVRDLIAQGDTLRLPNVDGRDMHRARVKLYDRADTLNLALRARLAGRTPVDSLAIATTWVNEYDAVNPARGAVSGRTLPAARVALGILERQLGSDHPALIAPLQRMAAVLTTIARANEALALGERQIALLERLTPYDTSAVSAALVSQASRRSTLGDYPGSARDAQRALAMREARFGAGSLQTADPIEWIAIAAARQGRYAEALAGFERCESIRRAGRSTGDTRLARALFNQAEILNQMGETDSARVRLGRALAPTTSCAWRWDPTARRRRAAPRGWRACSRRWATSPPRGRCAKRRSRAASPCKARGTARPRARAATSHDCCWCWANATRLAYRPSAR